MQKINNVSVYVFFPIPQEKLVMRNNIHVFSILVLNLARLDDLVSFSNYLIK